MNRTQTKTAGKRSLCGATITEHKLRNGLRVLIAERHLDPVVAAISREGSTYADGLPDTPAPPLPAMRHIGGRGNFLFVDSHVEGKTSWPELTFGPGTSGFDFWHGGHSYPGSSY